MNNYSILIGGKAGDGINQAGLLIARIFNQLGYRIYMYYDYPSLIRGGHNFSIVRATKNKVGTHLDQIDFLLVLNQDTIDFHKHRLKKTSVVIYDSDGVKSEGIGIPLKTIIQEEKATAISRNSCLIGGFCKAAGIKYNILEQVFKKHISRDMELNLRVAHRGYKEAKELTKTRILSQRPLPLVTGNEAIGLGLIKGGLSTYIAYPMTPSSGLLHFLARIAKDFSLKVIHPENEIAVILMALGSSYAGERTAVGTSGGGFCLMTEGLSLAGMSEVPIVIMVSQRPGPSTGVPTYTAQSDLHFVLNAGQGEFTRFMVSPGDAEEAYYWSTVAINISWRYQIPSIILVDKTLSEGVFSFEKESVKTLKEEKPLLWDKKQPYKRYLNTKTGISPLSFIPDKDAVIKVNSYTHDEYGITTEESQMLSIMQDKRLRKEQYLIQELQKYETVKRYGDESSSVALLCWGSTKGACVETAEQFGLRVVQPIVLSPFPIKQFRERLKGVKKIISVENNSTGQLVRLINQHGFNVDEKILKYDGRPFSLEKLEADLKKVIK